MALRKFKKAQGATEYAIFIAAVLAGLLALQVYYSRSVKGNMKGRADSIGEQFDGQDGSYVRETRSASTRQSYTNMNKDALVASGMSDEDATNWESRHSVNIAATAADATKIKNGGDSGTGEWLNVFGTVATAKHVSGDVSSTEYVSDDDFGDTIGFGTHDVRDMGNITGKDRNVWDSVN